MSTEIRSILLEKLAERIEAEFGPVGRYAALLRAVKAGRWNPGELSAPCATVTDDGQRLSELYRGDAAGAADLQRVLNVAVVLELPERWDQDGGAATWTDMIENLIGDLTKWREDGLGLIEVRYADDSPWTAVLQSGQSVQVWIVNFEVEYVTACAAAH